MVPSACVMPTPAPRGFAVGGSPAALPVPVGQAPGQADYSAVTQTAVSAALDVVRGMRPSITIDGRTFYGVMESTKRKYGGL